MDLPDTRPVTLHLPADMVRDMDEWAQAEHRSRTKQIQRLLEEALASRSQRGEEPRRDG